MTHWKSIAGATFAVAVMGLVIYFHGGDLRSVDVAQAGLLRGLTAAVLLYVTVVVLGAVAWRVLLKAFGAKPTGWAAERQLLISQIGKYIPGNVAQYVGRVAMAVSVGRPRTVENCDHHRNSADHRRRSVPLRFLSPQHPNRQSR